MIIQECLRYYKSKFLTILTIGLTLTLLSSYYISYLQEKEWEQVFESKAIDLNLDRVAEVISNYTGIYYFKSFFVSDSILIFFLIILIFGCINFLQSDRFTNNIFKFIFAQVLFLSSYLFCYFLIVFMFSILFIK
ncbi:hypothetical protein CN692_17490 [Bacillus sp. AFS002410]|uniref:hypothetical protein n=1 Tax=Bacillus sp. AFS002410 TaxID=2033481 RepID=UPI000BF167A5|nr:hypothetical protein [Bacillus sp. AFS002410]PEJ56392.1 hypothetical protein CN692_17490 [Bacillus sp. AFS002410]